MLPTIIFKFVGLYGKCMYVIKKQRVSIEDKYTATDRILDLGGGGEGVIGRLRGKQVVAIDTSKEELNDTPEGPVKIVADARDLPFQEGEFDIVTSFFFLMYTKTVDHEKIIRQAYKVLKKDGVLQIWDVVIPSPQKQRLFVIPIKIRMNNKLIETAYGTPWKEHEMCLDEIEEIGQRVGFVVKVKNRINETFYIEFKK